MKKIFENIRGYENFRKEVFSFNFRFVWPNKLIFCSGDISGFKLNRKTQTRNAAKATDIVSDGEIKHSSIRMINNSK